MNVYENFFSNILVEWDIFKVDDIILPRNLKLLILFVLICNKIKQNKKIKKN